MAIYSNYHFLVVDDRVASSWLVGTKYVQCILTKTFLWALEAYSKCGILQDRVRDARPTVQSSRNTRIGDMTEGQGCSLVGILCYGYGKNQSILGSDMGRLRT
jgi:hypothetical protein